MSPLYLHIETQFTSWTVQKPIHAVVPEQNSKLNIYVYIQYTVTIQLFQLKLSQTIVRCTII
jgi:hypothetical protein